MRRMTFIRTLLALSLFSVSNISNASSAPSVIFVDNQQCTLVGTSGPNYVYRCDNQLTLFLTAQELGIGGGTPSGDPDGEEGPTRPTNP